MHTTVLRTLTIALVAAPLLVVATGFGAVGRSADPAFAPLATVHAPAITIPLKTAAEPMSARPGLRFTPFDDDGCARLTQTVYRPDGLRQQTSEVFCRH